MYPFIRTFVEIYRARSKPKQSPFDTYSVDLRVMPWDLDLFMELNNGLTLTLYDIPRLASGQVTGMNKAAQRKNLKIAVAGSCVIYRKRITVFQKITISCKCVGVDDRFLYVVQNIKRGDEFVGQILVRKVTSQNGIVNPSVLMEEMGINKKDVPELPKWVKAWIDAEAQRPWPPEE